MVFRPAVLMDLLFTRNVDKRGRNGNELMKTKQTKDGWIENAGAIACDMTARQVKSPKPDYTIQIYFSDGDLWTAKVQSTRYQDGSIFEAKTIKAVMRKTAEWLEDN